jgi:2-polyprenyl-3-methyl-5-hydroxy-6-metoxy-1,4-benzoquinol methylase
VDFRALNRQYESLVRDVDRELAAFVDAIDVEALCRHNAGYREHAGQKFEGFVELEKNRFISALDHVQRRLKHGTICDLGCFVPYLPVALAMLGHEVKIVDKYGLYGAELKSSIERLASKWSIQVFDLDILSDDFAALGRNDVVFLMAVVEHLNGSPRSLMEKTRDIISDGGFLLFEVPNIAEFGKRLIPIRGRSVLPDYGSYLDSAYPFAGHNREMTAAEVAYLFKNTGYDVDELFCYDYGPVRQNGWKSRLLSVGKSLAPMKNKGHVIRAVVRPHK